jgi:serine/threonine-protein kinase
MESVGWLRDFARAQLGRVLLGKWTLVELLGIGGTAIVYEARHRNGKRVAIKLLRPDRALDPQIRERFQREGYTANAVGHPGVVRIDDDDVSDDGAAFLVMELLEGASLDKRALRAGGCLPWPVVVELMDQLLEILQVAHERNIIHRDIKPGNLFLTREGQLKVLDFGLARLTNQEPGLQSTLEGAVLGTPAFMAPEQARGARNNVTARTDIWAVGATAFFLLSARHVYEADTVNEQLAQAMTLPAPSVRDWVSDVPAGLAAVLQRALEYDPEDRWESAQQMLSELRSAAFTDRSDTDSGTGKPAELSSLGHGVSTPRPPFGRAPIGALMTAGATALAIGLTWFLMSVPPRQAKAPDTVSARPNSTAPTGAAPRFSGGLPDDIPLAASSLETAPPAAHRAAPRPSPAADREARPSASSSPRRAELTEFVEEPPF